MDSADSGSPKSSTDRDDDYEPRATADFINTHPPPPLFDPFSSYTQQHRQTLDTFSITSSNPAWPGSANTQRHTLINPFGQTFHQQPPPPPPSAGPANINNPGVSGGPRNPRKRSRASRRAPTTVLTTDTTNFRAMVQEFTGIPAPPFGHPSFPRPNRLDNLFGQSRSMEAATLPFLRQTFAAPPFLASSTPMINYQFSASHNTNHNNNENPFFSSLLQPNPSKFTFSGSSSKPHTGPSMNIGPGPEEFGLGDATTLNDLPNLISSDRGTAKWRRTGNDSDSDNNGVCRSQEGDRLKAVNGGYDISGSTSYSFQVEKESGSGLENQAAAGMVESWINSDLQSN